MTKFEQLATLITSMTYGEVTDLAARLRAIAAARAKEDLFDISDATNWAELIHGWAEAELDDLEPAQ